MMICGQEFGKLDAEMMLDALEYYCEELERLERTDLVPMHVYLHHKIALALEALYTAHRPARTPKPNGKLKPTKLIGFFRDSGYKVVCQLVHDEDIMTREAFDVLCETTHAQAKLLIKPSKRSMLTLVHAAPIETDIIDISNLHVSNKNPRI